MSSGETGERKYACPGHRLYLNDNCHWRPVDADMIEDIVWRSVTGLLTDPRALARCRPGDRLTLVGSEPTLDELIEAAHSHVAEAEGALAHAAVELVQARLPGQAIAAATEELQRSLDAAVTHRDDLLQRRRDATDVERLKRLRLDADIISAHLNHLTAPQQRAVLDMLAVTVRVCGEVTGRPGAPHHLVLRCGFLLPREEAMRKLLASLGVGALLAVMPTVAASAAPTSNPNTITFPAVVCIIPGHSTQSLLRFVVNGNANDQAPAHVYSFYNQSDPTLLGLFRPLTLTVYVNGQVEFTFVRQGSPQSGGIVFGCSGSTTLDTPDGPVTLSFTATGTFQGTRGSIFS